MNSLSGLLYPSLKTATIIIVIICFISAQEWEHYYTPNNFSSIDVCSDQIWLVPYTRINSPYNFYSWGLVQYDIMSDETMHHHKANSPLPTLTISAMFGDSQNRLWIGLQYHGLYLISNDWIYYDYSNNILPSVISDIDEDENGAIWALGMDSLSVFMNNEWLAIETPDWDSGGDYFNEIQVVNQNNIWIATRYNGLFHYKDGLWTQTTIDTLSGINIYSVNSISYVDSTLWLVSGYEDIYAYKNNEWYDYSIPDNRFYQIIGINDSTFWALSDDRLLYNSGSDTLFYSPPPELISNYDLSTFTIKDSIIYLANKDSIIFILDNNSWSIIDLEFDYQLSNHIWMTNFEGNEKWISTYSGLVNITEDTTILYNEDNSPLIRKVRPNAIDQNGYVWAGTWDEGIHRLDRSTGEWESWVGSAFTLPNDAIREIAIDQENNKWIGVWDAGFTIYDDDIWINYTVDNSNLPDPDVTTICHSSDGSHWVGTFGGGVVHINNDQWVLYNTGNSNLPGNNITKIAQHPDGTIWVGTNNNGAAYFDENEWVSLATSHPDLLYNVIRDIDFTTNGHTWISTYESGIFKYANNSIEYFHSGNSPLHINDVWTLDIGPDNKVWIGTWGNGLMSYTYDILSNQENDVLQPILFSLDQNYPNPFNPTTEIKYDLYLESQVSLVVYDIKGQLVKTLINQRQSPGEKGVIWNTKNNKGLSVSTGIYYYRIKINNWSETKKMIFIK